MRSRTHRSRARTPTANHRIAFLRRHRKRPWAACRGRRPCPGVPPVAQTHVNISNTPWLDNTRIHHTWEQEASQSRVTCSCDGCYASVLRENQQVPTGSCQRFVRSRRPSRLQLQAPPSHECEVARHARAHISSESGKVTMSDMVEAAAAAADARGCVAGVQAMHVVGKNRIRARDLRAISNSHNSQLYAHSCKQY